MNLTFDENNEKLRNYIMMKLFRSQKHLVDTVTCNNLTSSNLDNKMIIKMIKRY